MGVGKIVLASYLHVGGCREDCFSLVPTCRWVLGGMCQPRTYMLVGVGRRNVLASYLRVGGCREECVSLVPIRVGGCREECVSLVPTCRWVSGGEMC